jgi:hypothetical protein
MGHAVAALVHLSFHSTPGHRFLNVVACLVPPDVAWLLGHSVAELARADN